MAKLTKLDSEYIAKIKPISKATLESIRKQTSKHIFVEKDGTAFCERCNGTSVIADTKHKGVVKCPNCGHKMEVWHTWRKKEKSEIAYTKSWVVLAKALSNTELMLQYVLVSREGRKVLGNRNCAVEILDFGNKKEYHYEMYNDAWASRTYDYFREYGMGYSYRTMCCLQAKVHNKLFYREVGKIDIFKYINVSEFNNDKNNYYMDSILCHFSKKVDLIEKLQKSGLSGLVWHDLATYSHYDEIKYDNTQTELTKMLRITKRNLDMLKRSPLTLSNLIRLQDNNNISDSDFNDLMDFSQGEEKEINRIAETIGVSIHKVIKYVKAQGIGVHEYSGLIATSRRCGYSNKDKAYSMPKDFHKEMTRLQEIEAERERRRAEREAEEIRKIEEAKASILASIKAEVESNKELKEFFSKSKKYMCYVPGSVEDFVNEGNNQHNCVGGSHYSDAVAKKETFVFFIREVNNPKASFVTCECKDGQIVQIMYDKNVRVEHDTEVYQFADAFAKRLSATQKKAV